MPSLLAADWSSLRGRLHGGGGGGVARGLGSAAPAGGYAGAHHVSPYLAVGRSKWGERRCGSSWYWRGCAGHATQSLLLVLAQRWLSTLRSQRSTSHRVLCWLRPRRGGDGWGSGLRSVGTPAGGAALGGGSAHAASGGGGIGAVHGALASAPRLRVDDQGRAPTIRRPGERQ